ncbi:hypothetical protein [Micromonospora mirobrigensis]|uniref:Uncharacterized protein n=1 Tax=Micromonospora mirobrigensis TaxID=262898 RepID=A0A1C4V2K0_9ACTN|nr:hypothetical protein [Micromonospora mirobrigensis]SCE78051.1 hypothetical protein GA0070564_101898 [Micromonospora mirobrigensis]
MTAPGIVRPALFLATPTVDGPDGPEIAFDRSAEGMRRLRDPFAVHPAGPTATGNSPTTLGGSPRR